MGIISRAITNNDASVTDARTPADGTVTTAKFNPTALVTTIGGSASHTSIPTSAAAKAYADSAATGLPGLTASVAELNYTDGVTGPIQTQFDSKQPKFMTGTVGTAAATAAKTVTLDAPWTSYTPVAGDIFLITYTSGSSVSSASLNINGSGAVTITTASGGTNSTNHAVTAGAATLYRYDGTTLRTFQTVVTLNEISDAEIIDPTSTSARAMSGRRAGYLKRKAIATVVTSSATPAISLDLGDWSTISVAHNITAVTTTGTGGDLQTVNLKLVGTGSYTLAFGSAWNFGFGVSAPTSIANAKAIYIRGCWNVTTSKIDVLDVKMET